MFHKSQQNNFRREGLHICEQNCALTVQEELEFWGIDDSQLQVIYGHWPKLIKIIWIVSENIYIFAVHYVFYIIKEVQDLPGTKTVYNPVTSKHSSELLSTS